jgi:ElaB/YqjD/DUF883 family membrane-anchored ribosome-binding protein
MVLGKEEKVQEAAQRGEISGLLVDKERALHGMGSGMTSAAERIRERAPQEGRAGRIAEKVASTLETGGRYLAERDVPAIADDVAGVVTRYPMQSMWVGLGVGFLLGRLISSRTPTPRRY